MELALERLKTDETGRPTEIERAQAGDTAAFESLYRQNVGRVYALCLRIVANDSRAEELTQQAFIRAWEMLGSFRGESAFSSWLHRIAVNIVLGDLRLRKRQFVLFELQNISEETTPDEQHPSAETTVDLEKAIASLPPKARAVFVLHDIEGYRHHEIAEMMNLAEGTSKAQLFRARNLLKERLTQ